MAGGDYYARFAGSLYVFIILCTHFIFIHGRGLAIQKKTKEIGMHEGTVKTIESEDGDVIDCVEIYKQPAFNHPLLKNHTIQMKPSFLASDDLSVETENPMLFQSWHKNGECPEGTIPIIRSEKINFPPRSHPPIPTPNQSFVQVPRHEYAQVSLMRNDSFGAHAFINVWQPKKYNDEYSSAQIWVLSGRDLGLNAIEAGWMVKDDENPRLFNYWTSDCYQNTGCYNLQCPGFVQVNKNIGLGSHLTPGSVYNGVQTEINMVIRRDEDSENWWLEVQNQAIGYWPSPIFTELHYSASTITWGGEVLNDNVEGHHTETQMGSGHFPVEGFGKASFFRNLGYYNLEGALVDATNVTLYATRPSCYKVEMSNVAPFGTRFFFGGPGYSPDCL